MDLSKPLLSSIPIWVKFFRIAPVYWSEEGLSYVVSAIGKPLYFDSLTEARTRLSFVQACAKVDIRSEFPTVFDLDLGDCTTCEIIAEYPWKPQVCKSCKCCGHTTTLYPVGVKEVCVPKKVDASNAHIVYSTKVTVISEGDSVVDSIIVVLNPLVVGATEVVIEKPSVSAQVEVLSPYKPVIDLNPFQLLADTGEATPSVDLCDGDASPAPSPFAETGSSPEYNFKHCNLKVDELSKKPGGSEKKSNPKKSKGKGASPLAAKSPESTIKGKAIALHSSS